jgi:poly[(R)-3-hydroxyalkanoate] polymerase subunit PhaE
MAETSAPPFPGDTWFEESRKYWETWQASWWGTAAPASPAPDVMQALTDQGKLFLRLGEELAAALSRPEEALRSEQDWLRVFQAAAESWRAGLGAPPPDAASLNTAWTLPFDTWSRTFSSGSLFPGDFLAQFKPESWTHATDDLRRNVERFLSVPGLGYTREWQEQGQEFARLGLNYQRALQDYGALFRRLNLDAFDRLQRRLGEVAKAEQPITTLRGLYDVWVDCSEAAYLDLVSTDAYAEAYGRMVNALMALKRQSRNMVDEAAGAMGMPTRQGLNTLQRRHQELRRELAAVRRAAEGKAGREEVAALRKELDRLRSELTGASRPPADTKRAAARNASRPRRPSDRGPKAKGG